MERKVPEAWSIVRTMLVKEFPGTISRVPGFKDRKHWPARWQDLSPSDGHEMRSVGHGRDFIETDCGKWLALDAWLGR